MKSSKTVRSLTFAALVALVAAPVRAFDHGALDRALRATVSNGSVDYTALRTNRDLATYVAALPSAAPAKLSTNDRLAFWINAYNALVLKSVVDHPRIARPLDVEGFFNARRHSVAGRSLTLNQIEHDIIRKEFSEPLVHFGLVCAAVSCPQILPEAYRGATVRAVLAANARRYLASSQNGVDRTRRVVRLSQIFEWYKADFGGDRGLRAFLRTYAPATFTEVLSAGGTIEYRPYEWRLNGKW
jgi:hypothetical protein